MYVCSSSILNLKKHLTIDATILPFTITHPLLTLDKILILKTLIAGTTTTNQKRGQTDRPRQWKKLVLASQQGMDSLACHQLFQLLPPYTTQSNEMVTKA